MHTPEIAQAYRNTTYRVDHPDGGFGIRVGERSRRLDALLAMHGVRCWAYLTASNPRSEKLSPEINRLRNAALMEQVKQQEFVIYPGRGEPDTGDWVAEESVLILGIDASAALRLGAQFDQHAVLAGEAGGPAKLMWCSAPGRELRR